MKNQIRSLVACLLFAGTVGGQTLPSELQTPEVVSVNRMPMRADAFAFETKALAEKKAKEASKYFISLNGNWRFNWVQDPNKRPKDFYSKDFDDSKWVNFPVPANWEVNGYGLPIYVNHPYEFTGRAKTGSRLNPPFDIPDDNNPVGSYRKKVIIPADWDGRQVFIHLGAVKSAFFIWVNGQKVGYSEDSKLSAEFDITKYVQPGENLVALQVYRWSDGSYLECQDMWRISGIEREVYLYATPLLDVRDFKIGSTLENNYKDGAFTFWGEVNSYKTDTKTLHSKGDTATVELELVDNNGAAVFKEALPAFKVLGRYKTELSFTKTIPGVKTWTAETPNLYTLFITLKNKAGETLEVVPVRVGFRSIEIKGRDFLVNGKRVFFKGVNRHEHNARTGHTLTHTDMEKDMEMMKKLNINAVRQSHYPPDPYWLELCDTYGLYVIDEANIESHGRYYDLEYTFANDKQWRMPHLARIQRMYERDKNHPAIITWSLGNEAGNGINMYEGYDWLKKKDSRPVQYERAEYDYNTDVICPQYPSPSYVAWQKNSKDGRPYIMSEYAHIMGNSLGNFKEYWDAIESTPGTQGGYIWEWIDQGIDTVKNGKRILAYGGDFPLSGPVDENFSDNDFCVKGVVTAYRHLTPMAIEIKKVHQNIKTAYKGNNEIEVTNAFFFKDLSNVKLNWEITEDGAVAAKGTLASLNLDPQAKAQMALPIKLKLKEGKEYLLNVSYRLKNEEPFLDKDYEIAAEQFAYRGAPAPYNYQGTSAAVTAVQNGNSLLLKGAGFAAGFDLGNGLLTQYSLKGTSVLTKGPQPAFYRAPTDNDIGAGLNRSLRNWRNVYEAATNVQAKTEQVSKSEYRVTFTADLLGGKAKTEQVFTVYGDGTILVKNNYELSKGDYRTVMRIGNDLELGAAFSKIQWYGRGPWENYWDRHTASNIGKYSQTIDQQYFPYARPQESGNKTDVRWISLQNSKGLGIRFELADSVLSAAALPYSLEQLDPAPVKKQFHSGELEKADRIFMHLDLKQLGLQGMDSWGAMPLKEYWLPAGTYAYSYWIRPLR
ncbi:glycoside hydrolase family 2 TIM barrel-domain containing protein [Niabella hirudinis]|uniref:glycoside hydrolase family 2 TIM barrel-domain containing protein n=1 Tax=Niabella hirudinis TaxID=1285929 RepID=UPI003EBEDF44